MADLNIGNSSASVVVNAKHNGSVIPQINNTYDLGTSDLRWKNIHGGTITATTFVGLLNGNASTSTAANYLESFDTRSTNLTPSELRKGFHLDFKANSINGLNDGGSYNGMLSWRSYGGATDLSGGLPIQIAYTQNGNLWTRMGASADTWGTWTEILNGNNYTKYTVTKTGSGASGTWGINISGNAMTATNADELDGYHFSDLENRYVKKSGDTMTGSLHSNIGDRKLSSATTPAHFIGNLHFYSTQGNGSSITDGTVNGITFGSSPTTAYAGIYSPSSHQYGNYLMFATTDSYADGSKTRMVIDHVGRVGIGTTAPNYTLHVNGTQYIQSNSSSSTTEGLTINNGVLAVTNYNQALTVGALNESWVHFQTSGSQFYFNKQVHIDGNLTRYNYSGAGYGTISGYNLAGNAATATRAEYLGDKYSNDKHGANGNGWYSIGEAQTIEGNYMHAPLAINWYWGIDMRSMDVHHLRINGARVWSEGMSVTGAVWNDYAEYREANTIQGGRCVREVGDDTLSLTTKRLMRGCSITSDTWGFAQGETEKAKTPIAVAGRVLAYPLEDRELFKEYIGYSVCSGPNGTVSLMTEEEELKYPWAIVGTVSAVPDYEEWGGGEMADRPSVKVDGRIWIKVK